MLISKKDLLSEAKAKGYKPDMLEKVYRLLDIFQQMMSIPYLRQRLVLKGGTALNLFYYQTAPRLSVDIDLNYIGAVDRETMLSEKPLINDALEQIMRQNQLEPDRTPTQHAGGKMIWYANSVLGQRSALEIDINYMYRQPLWPIILKQPNVGGYENWQAPILNIHELTAGKLTALFDRRVSRDFFDAHYLLNQASLKQEKLRIALTTYLAMTEIDLNMLKPETIQYNLSDLKNRLLPTLHQQGFPRARPALTSWSAKILGELHEKLAAILPLQSNEIDFITTIRNTGEIKADLITTDIGLAEKIKAQPALHWAAKRSQSLSSRKS